VVAGGEIKAGGGGVVPLFECNEPHCGITAHLPGGVNVLQTRKHSKMTNSVQVFQAIVTKTVDLECAEPKCGPAARFPGGVSSLSLQTSPVLCSPPRSFSNSLTRF